MQKARFVSTLASWTLAIGFAKLVLGAGEPLAYWDFDEPAGTTVTDRAGHGLNGTLHGTTARVPGRIGQALSLKGQGYMEVPANPRLRLGTGITLELWFQPADTNVMGFQYLVQLWGNYLLRLDTRAEGGRLSWFTFLDAYPEPRLSNRVPEAGRWHQAIAVWDGARLRLWLDGALRELERKGTPTPQDQPLQVGLGFIGLVDELKLYDRALSDAEVLALIPPRLATSLTVTSPIVPLGKEVRVACTISNLGGQRLTNGSVRLDLPDGARLSSGARAFPVRMVTPANGATVVWQVQADAALAGTLKAVVEFPGQASATNLADLTVSRRIPAPEPPGAQPAITVEGSDLVIGNGKVRLVFPKNPYGYGVYGVDVRAAGAWRRLAVASALARLELEGKDGPARYPVFASAWQAITNTPGQVTLEFGRSIEDATGNRWEFASRFTVGDDDRVHTTLEAVPQRDARLLSLSGPALYAGQDTFGRAKDDALFCGLEWLVGDESSSSNLDMHDPDFYVRYVPHPNKITVPLMSVAQGGAALALFWDCRQRWDGVHDRPAAVFASPNFIDGQENHLMGLFLPSVPDWVAPNHLAATGTPYHAVAGAPLRLEAWLSALAPATHAIECLPRWFATFGVPEPAPLPRGDYARELDFSLRAFLESLWVATNQTWWNSKGGGELLSVQGHPPHFAFQLRLGALLTTNQALRDQCLARAALAEQLGRSRAVWDDVGLTYASPQSQLYQLRDAATRFIDSMGADGAWRFHTRIETNGLNKGRDYSLLGPDGAAELGTCARNAYEILRYARLTGDREAYAAAKRSLEFMRQFTVPRAAQVWECPVHSPDILAAADTVDAYVEAYRIDGDRAHLAEAIRWARAGLPFVYAWNPDGHPMLRYASIAILGGSWFEGSWIGQPVQWNGLRYAYALLKLSELDTSFPWRRIGEGLTVSALYQQDADGPNVALWPDNFSAIDWSKCAWVFEPGQILRNIFRLEGRDIDPTTLSVAPGFRLSARATFSDAAFANNRLSVTVEFPASESGLVLVAGVSRPGGVLLNGQTVPEAVTDLWAGTGPGWQYDAGLGAAVLKPGSTGRHRVELQEVAFRPGRGIPSLSTNVAFEFDVGPEGWFPASQVSTWEVRDGLWRGTATGGDPYLVRSRVRFQGEDVRRVSVRMRATAGSGLALFWTTAASPVWAEDKTMRLPFADRNTMHEYVFQVATHPLWRGQTITALRLDPFEGGPGGDFEIDSIRGE